MRKALSLVLLVAGTALATPALAQDWGSDGVRADRQSEGRAQRALSTGSAQTQSRVEAPRQVRAAPQQRVELAQRGNRGGGDRGGNRGGGGGDRGNRGGGWNGGGGGNGGGGWNRGNRDERPAVQAPAPRPQRQNFQGNPNRGQNWNQGNRGNQGGQNWQQRDRNDRREWRQDNRDDRREWRQDNRDDRREWRQDNRDDRREWRQDNRRPGWNNNNRPGNRPGWNGNRGNDNRRWNNGWRNDNRYDWQGWRYQNRNLFRLRPYYSPYNNWSYRRFGIGSILDSLFWGRNYWISDPWTYRLPPAGPGLQWVRYYDDVLLIDTYDGSVIDVIYDFFW